MTRRFTYHVHALPESCIRHHASCIRHHPSRTRTRLTYTLYRHHAASRTGITSFPFSGGDKPRTLHRRTNPNVGPGFMPAGWCGSRTCITYTLYRNLASGIMHPASGIILHVHVHASRTRSTGIMPPHALHHLPTPDNVSLFRRLQVNCVTPTSFFH
jgi:hypothetical protein